jgi:DNA-binding CsgD family transcriptional regulator
MAYSNLSQLRMLADDRDEAIRWGMRAIALAESFGDQETLVHALNNVGTATQDKKQGRAYLERSLELARAAGFEDHAVRAYANLVANSVRCYDTASADFYFAEGLAYCADRDLDIGPRYMEGWHATSLLYRGEWDEAAATATALLNRPSLAVVNRIMPLCVLGRVRARRGDPEVADVLDEALALAERTGEVQRIGPVRAARAEAAWLMGDAERTRAEARAGIAVAVAHQNQIFTDELAYWSWRGGEERSALPPLGTTPFALQIAGGWEDASRAWVDLGLPYESAWALAEGDECALRHALTEFERLGARAAIPLVARELRTRGVRGIPRGPRPTTRATPALLTRRELEIVRLLAEGLRNAEIADRLSLSPKTVDHHVSAVLAKLGVRSRLEAVQEAEKRGLLRENGDVPPPN